MREPRRTVLDDTRAAQRRITWMLAVNTALFIVLLTAPD
jgi:hypothetical protein